MTTIRKWICVWSVLLMAGRCLGSPGDALTVSEWSPVRSNLALRVSCPRRYEYDAKALDIYVKCEIKNTGTGEATVYQRGRVFLVDAAGQTNRCIGYTGGLEVGPTLEVGEVSSWWQNGKIPGEGSFALFVRWNEDEGLESERIPISLVASTIEEKDLERVRAERLQERADSFLALVPNTEPGTVAYAKVNFTNDPVIVKGCLYNAFSFEVPEQAGDLVWSFALEDPDHNGFNWYILPDQGTMRGFPAFDRRYLQRDVPGVGKKGDVVVFQFLQRAEFKPRGRYLMWFQSLHRDVPSVTVSLNFLDRTGISLADIYTGIFGPGWKAMRGGLD